MNEPLDAYDLELAAYVDNDAQLAARVTANLEAKGIKDPSPELVAMRVAYFRARAMPDSRRRDRLQILLDRGVDTLNDDELLELQGLCLAVEVDKGSLTKTLLRTVCSYAISERLVGTRKLIADINARCDEADRRARAGEGAAADADTLGVIAQD
jgi:hypothetical protein